VLSSCLIQKGYFANPPNVNCFENENEKNLKLSQGLNHFETQSNIAINKNIGISTCIYGGFKGQYGAEIAGIIYKKLNEKKYFETQIGYGYFNNKSMTNGYSNTMFTIASYNIKATYHKMFIQPTFFITTKSLNFGLTIKINAVYFDKYHSYYNYKDFPDEQDIVHERFSTTEFKNKWDFVYEPVITIQYKGIIYMQFSGIFSRNRYESLVYGKSYLYYKPTLTTNSAIINIDNRPQHATVLFTVGHEFKFKKKK